MIQINSERLEKNIQEFACFGINEQGGIHRSIGSQADLDARNWLIHKAQSLGAKVDIDGVANLWFTLPATATAEKQKLQPITIGSHHDAVPNGGRFDGAMGVLLGLEVMERLLETKQKMVHPFQVVSFSAEEPNPYRLSTMGSRSVTGKITESMLRAAVHCDNGESLESALVRAGGSLERLDQSQLTPNSMAAFIECHIEQGRMLYDRHLPGAVVSTITGIYREQLHISGEANHAGTTLMGQRHDAFLAAAEVALAVEQTASDMGRSDVVGTAGWVEIHPNSANIIPADADLIFEIRMPRRSIQEQMVAELDRAFSQIEQKRQVTIERRILLNQPEAHMNAQVMEALADGLFQAEGPENQKELEKYPELVSLNQVPVLVSMAGHDAVHMSSLAPTGMLFVQSKEGKSHCPEEDTHMDHIEIAGNALLQAVWQLDKELNR